MSSYNSKNRTKCLLQVHIIFSTKYRKQILEGVIGEDIKQKMVDISQRSRFEISTIEVDKDHIHMLISHEPNISISQIVRKLKSESTAYIWDIHGELLKYKFWNSKKFWTPAYFACSVGDASEKTIREYIDNQG